MFGHKMKITPALILVAVALAAITFLVIKRMSLKNSRTTGEWPPEVVAKVEKDRAAREAVRQQDPQLFAADQQQCFATIRSASISTPTSMSIRQRLGL
jgi:hypothetical protein